MNTRLSCCLPKGTDEVTYRCGKESSPGVWCSLTDIHETGTALPLWVCIWMTTLCVSLLPSTSDHRPAAVLGASQCVLWEMTRLPLPPSEPLLIVYIPVC